VPQCTRAPRGFTAGRDRCLDKLTITWMPEQFMISPSSKRTHDIYVGMDKR